MVRVLLIFISLGIAVASGWATKRFIEQERDRIARTAASGENAKPKGDEVLVVSADVPIGGIITARMLDWRFWPQDNILDIHITRTDWPNAPAELDGVGTRQPLFAGDPVVEGKIIRPGEGGFLAAVLSVGKRAVTLTVDQATGLAGLVHPGDRVDVILTHNPPTMFGGSGGAEAAHDSTAAETILRNIRVLAVDKTFSATRMDIKKSMPSTVTLEVDPHQAETLALGRSMGRLSLVLRSSFGDGTNTGDRPRHFTRDIEISELMQQGTGHPNILVATRTLTAGELVSDMDFEWRQPSATMSERDYFVEGRDTIRQMRGSLITIEIPEGEPVRRRHLLRPTDPSFVSRALRPGYRAVSIPVDASTAVSGFITPGDIVDIILTDQWDDERETAILKTRYFGETIAARVRVLSLPLGVNGEDGGSDQRVQASATATLEVSPTQAESLTMAQDMGSLTLILRSRNDPAELTDSGPESGRTPWVEPMPKLAAHRTAGGLGESKAAPVRGRDTPPGSYSFELDTSDALKALVIEPLVQSMAAQRLREGTSEDRQSITVYRGNQPQSVPLR